MSNGIDIAPVPSRRRRTPLIVGAAVLAVAALGALWAARPAKVRTVRPERRTVVSTVVVSGRVMAPARVELGVQIAGVVQSALVREGDRVKAGQLLAQLDDRERAAAVAQARATLAGAGAGEAKVADVDERVAREEARQASLALARAQEELTRQKRLFAAGAGTQKERDDAARAVADAESRARAAETRRDAAAPTGAGRRSVRAQRIEAEAALELAASRLEQTRVVAPADGVILSRDAEPGALVQPGKVLFVFTPLGETRLTCAVDEKDVVALRVGQPALASAEAAPDSRFPAEVSYVAPSIDPQRATVEVRLRVPAPPAFLRPDMTVSIDIRTGAKDGALVLPTDAVHDLAGDAPWVLAVRDGRARRTPVKLGLRGQGFVEVVDGLGADATVIPTSQRTKEGARVRAAG